MTPLLQGQDKDILFRSLQFLSQVSNSFQNLCLILKLSLWRLGIAVYVIGITVSNTPATNYSLNSTKMFFEVDGIDHGSFFFEASLGSEVVYSYNTTLFAKEGLSNGLHNVTMMCGNGVSNPDSICLLDRIIYT